MIQTTGNTILFISLFVLIGMMVAYNIILSRINKRVQDMEVGLSVALQIITEVLNSFSDYVDKIKQEEENKSSNDSVIS